MPDLSVVSFVRRSGLAVGVVSVAALGFSSAAHAVPPLVTLQYFCSADMSEALNWNLATVSDEVNNSGNGLWQFIGAQQSSADGKFGDPVWELDWDVSVNSNANGVATSGHSASVTADLGVFNSSANTEIFWALVTVNLDNPILGGTFMDGTVQASVQNFFGNNANLSTITSGNFEDEPIYAARIDGAEQRTMWDAPFSLTAPPGVLNSASTNFGDPSPEIGPDANNSISVWLRFELAPGDSASVIGTFQIEAIPAPGVLPVLAGFGLFATRRRRRER